METLITHLCRCIGAGRMATLWYSPGRRQSRQTMQWSTTDTNLAKPAQLPFYDRGNNRSKTLNQQVRSWLHLFCCCFAKVKVLAA